MLKLKLELMIVPRRGNTVLSTGLRVFDKRSYFAVYAAIVNGALGRHSKSSFFLKGHVIKQESDDENDLLLEETQKHLWYPTWHDAAWEGVDKLLSRSTAVESWTPIFHPFFRKVEGELYLFLAPRVRQVLGITREDVKFHVFMQNYGSHLPILP